MKCLSRPGGIGETEYDLETEEWIELGSTFLNEKTSGVTKIISRNKKKKNLNI